MPNVLILAAATAIVSVAAPASAAETARSVGYADLNLQKDAGVSVLKQRVRQAAQSVCSTSSSNLSEVTRSRNCVAKSMSEAEGAVAHAIRTARAS